MGKVIFALKGICSHSLYHWIRIEKCANTHLHANPVMERVGAYALEGKKTAFATHGLARCTSELRRDGERQGGGGGEEAVHGAVE